MKDEFLTLSEDVRDIGPLAATHYKKAGHKVVIEPNKLGWPDRPALVATRSGAETFVLIAMDAALDRVHAWASYAKCLERDSRVSLVVPAGAAIAQEKIEELKAAKVGFLTAGAGKVAEMFAPVDLTMHAGLPPAGKYHKKMRAGVSEIVEKFERGEWQDAMFDSQVLMETRARQWLLDGTKSGRIKVLDQHGVVATPTQKEIKKATMGALKNWFLNIQSPNAGDNALAEALEVHNPFRIKNAHDKLNPVVRKKLKPRAAQMVWVAFEAVQKTYE